MSEFLSWNPIFFITIFLALILTAQLLERTNVARIFLCCLLSFSWFAFYSPSIQYASIIAAAAFSGIEFSWYSTTTQNPDGTLSFTPFAKTCRKGHTTWAQFWANVMFTPMLIFAYSNLIPNSFLRMLLYPLNVWNLEIIEGYLLIYLFDKNVAWNYDGPDAYFHGNIKLGYYIQWYLLGALIETIGYNAIIHLANFLSFYVFPWHLLIFFGFLTIKSITAKHD